MKPEAEKIGGLNVPDAPPVPADLYCPYEFWVYGETSTQLFNVDLDEKWPGMTHSPSILLDETTCSRQRS